MVPAQRRPLVWRRIHWGAELLELQEQNRGEACYNNRKWWGSSKVTRDWITFIQSCAPLVNIWIKLPSSDHGVSQHQLSLWSAQQKVTSQPVCSDATLASAATASEHRWQRHPARADGSLSPPSHRAPCSQTGVGDDNTPTIDRLWRRVTVLCAGWQFTFEHGNKSATCTLWTVPMLLKDRFFIFFKGYLLDWTIEI